MPKAELASLARTDYTLGILLMNYAIAFALAFLWATVYRKTHTGVAYTRSFYVTLILIAPTVAMVMMAIGSNVALSLGLVGTLSIIRFRTVIKDTKDMAFLIMSIAIGLTCGSNTWMVGAVYIEYPTEMASASRKHPSPKRMPAKFTVASGSCRYIGETA